MTLSEVVVRFAHTATSNLFMLDDGEVPLETEVYFFLFIE